MMFSSNACISIDLVSEAELRDELLQLQNKAVICFNKEMFAEAEANFTEALQVMSMLFPANHPEVTKLERSLELVRRKAKSSEIMKNRQARRKH